MSNEEIQICRLCLQPLLPKDKVLSVNVSEFQVADASIPKPLVHAICVYKRTGLEAEPGFSVQEL